jgi:hypothetical protein
MKSHPIKLTKKEAITIAYRALMERVMEQPGIWTHLNARIRRMQLVTVATESSGRYRQAR